MGKTEKIVVLSVLFAVVVLFVWSLDQGDAHGAGPGTSGSGTPGSGESATAERGGAQPGETGSRGDDSPSQAGPGLRSRDDDLSLGSEGQGGSPNGAGGRRVDVRPHPSADGREDASPLLIAGIEPNPRRAPEGDPGNDGIVLRTGWDLVSTEGLTRTFDPETFAATSRTGDTWATLALRFYGDVRHASLLERSNEGTRLTAGTAILVPAVDRLPQVPEVREVEVLDGEGLWHVAARVLGDGNRWREIYAANTDRLENANRVKAGILLRVP